ncbi:MORN repeat-containing protein 3 isoform X1 [Bos indicus x Bos taurus]|nr:MORN repeat-containing protein 3 isoform X1 [Bos indicus x Bos taurus]
MRSPGLAHLPLAPGLCTNWHSTSTGPKTSFLVAGGFAVFPIRGPASSVSAGRGGPCRLALQRPRVAITTPAGLWTPEHEPQAAIEAGGCGRRPHRCLPGTPDPDSAPQESAEAANMPIFKCPQKSEPLWKEWDQKAQKNGLRHQVFAVNGDHYVGEWKDNVKHGKGTQVWKKNGAIYEGDWKSGKRDGYGTLSLPDQETGKYKRAYSGWWKGDKKCGYGIQFFGPKEYYEGDWCGNQRSGWGRMYYSNGDIYEGQWRNDKPEGEGMLRLSQNSRSRRCVGGSLGHVQEDKRRRRLMPERTPALQEEFKPESPNCSDRCSSCWRSKWGHTLGTFRRHLTPSSTGSFLPRRRPVLLSPAGLGDPLVTVFFLGPHL